MPAPMTPTEIPRPQVDRVRLYGERIGSFDSTKNAYWSLREGRPVTLAEGARLDTEMRAGRRARSGTTRRAVIPATNVQDTRMRGGGAFTQQVAPVRARMRRLAAGGGTTMERIDPRRARAEETIIRDSPAPRVPSPPVTTGKSWKVMDRPPEIAYAEAQPATPIPGETSSLFESVARQAMRALTQAQPDAASRALTPSRSLVSVARGAAPSREDRPPPFDAKKLILPAIVVGGALLAARML